MEAEAATPPRSRASTKQNLASAEKTLPRPGGPVLQPAAKGLPETGDHVLQPTAEGTRAEETSDTHKSHKHQQVPKRAAAEMDVAQPDCKRVRYSRPPRKIGVGMVPRSERARIAWRLLSGVQRAWLKSRADIFLRSSTYRIKTGKIQVCVSDPPLPTTLSQTRPVPNGVNMANIWSNKFLAKFLDQV